MLASKRWAGSATMAWATHASTHTVHSTSLPWKAPEMVEDACGNQAPLRRRKTPQYAPSAPGTKPRPARDDRFMLVGDESSRRVPCCATRHSPPLVRRRPVERAAARGLQRSPPDGVPPLPAREPRERSLLRR